MTNLESRLQDAYNKMSMEEKYQLLESMEHKNLGKNENYNPDFMESIVNVILDTATLIAKCLRIVK